MCGSRKYPVDTPPYGRSLEIPTGGGYMYVLKTKILEGKYQAKLEFPLGRGGGE